MMQFGHRFAILAPALLLEELVIGFTSWKLAIAFALILGLLASFRARGSTGVLDLIDRSTLYFGLLAGAPIGIEFARGLDSGLGFTTAIGSAFVTLAGAAFFIILAISFWIRKELIRRSLRKGYSS